MLRAEDRELTTDETDVVSVLRTALAGKVGRERFELWFGGNTRLTLCDGALIVGAPNRFFQEWIRQNFRQQIEDVCTETLGKCPALEFHIDSTLGIARSEPAVQGTTSTATVPLRRGAAFDNRPFDGAAVVSAALEAATSHLEARAEPVAHGDSAANGSPAARGGEAPLGYARSAPMDLASFVAGATNRLAFASAETAARQPGRLTPLLIHGPTGVGKTHLLRGICHAARKLRPELRAIYLSAEHFTTGFLEALRGSGLPNFRRKYRGVELLLLDDLHFLIGKRATQVELLHTIDELLREGRQLVFAADRAPMELTDLGPELTARLQSGMVCLVDPPDYATRLGIVGQMARRFALSLPQDVQEFVAAQLTCHARELSGALCRLQATSQATGRPITLAMAREALTELIRQSSRMVRLPDIERAVCDIFGVEPAGLQSGRKDKSVSHPRMLAMWLARKHTRAALSEIGEFFGRRSHSTVISAQRRIEDGMASGMTIELANRHWNLDEAIRLVERRLRTG
jgi:chromosomal replication initiator protein